MGWTTHDELTYLTNIGTYAMNSPKLDRKKSSAEQHETTTKLLKHKVEMLTKYLASAELRSWKNLEREKILDFAQSELTRISRLVTV